jgi:FKBP-type peptidyl-prolyl cis-trans isomerase SlyD
MNISAHKAVYLNYTLRNENGEILDASEGQPLAYIHGLGFLIPGLERNLEGRTTGDKFNAVISPDEGYGAFQDELVLKAPLANFQGENLQVGMEVELDLGEEQAVALVTAIEGNDVTLDLNHPLAGETLYFEVEIMQVREASEEELDHGHIHGPGGHHH